MWSNNENQSLIKKKKTTRGKLVMWYLDYNHKNP